MQLNPQSKEESPRVSGRSSLEEKFAAYDKLIQSGYRLFGDYINDDCINDGHDDDDADCNDFNCC